MSEKNQINKKDVYYCKFLQNAFNVNFNDLPIECKKTLQPDFEEKQTEKEKRQKQTMRKICWKMI